nr:putative HSP20-like chaperone [Tanacetum cinerariifolium]
MATTSGQYRLTNPRQRDDCRSLVVDQASSSADPDILEMLKQQPEDQARAAEDTTFAPQYDEAKQKDSFRCDECCSLDVNQASVSVSASASASADPDMVQPNGHGHHDIDDDASGQLVKGKNVDVVGLGKSGYDIARSCAEINGPEDPCMVVYRHEHRESHSPKLRTIPLHETANYELCYDDQMMIMCLKLLRSLGYNGKRTIARKKMMETKIKVSKINIGERSIFCILEKVEPKWWKKLLKGDPKSTHYVRVDWDKWVDEDDDAAHRS